MDVQGLSTEELIAELSAFAVEDGEAAALVSDLRSMQERGEGQVSGFTPPPMGYFVECPEHDYETEAHEAAVAGCRACQYNTATFVR